MNCQALSPTASHWLPLFQPWIPVFVALVVAWLGIRSFYRQRRFELIRQRYLDQAIDQVAAHVDELLSLSDIDYAAAHRLLKIVRDSGFAAAAAACPPIPTVPVESRLLLRPFYRLKELTGSRVFSNSYQSLVAKVGAFHNEVHNELFRTVRHHASAAPGSPDVLDAAKFHEYWFGHLVEARKELAPFYSLLNALQALAHIFERTNFSLAEVNRLPRNKHVRDIVKQLEHLLPSDASDSGTVG